MIETFEDFINAMREYNTTVSAKVNIIDNYYNNGSFFEAGKYAMYEGDGITLDGSYNVLQDVDFTELEGWYSLNLSDENAEFSNNTAYEENVKHDKLDNADLHIIFSNIREEYAVDFDVIITNNENSKTFNYRNNTEKEVMLSNIETGSDVKIIFYKWSRKYSRAKVLNMYLGTTYHYEDDEIILINSKKGVDLINEEIQSKEIEIKIVDADDNYNIFEDPRWDSLSPDTKIEIFLGVLIDNFIYYVKVEECYYKKVEKKGNDLELSIIGIGILQKYQNAEWYNLYEEMTREPWLLEAIINNIDNKYYKLKEKIQIDDEIIEDWQHIMRCFDSSDTINNYLNNLAINCRSNLIETNNNKVVFKRIKISEPVATINLENMEEEPEIEREEEKYNILIKQYGSSISNEKEEVYGGRFTVDEEGVARLNPNKSIEFLDDSYNSYDFILNIYNADGTLYKGNITTEQEFYITIYFNRIVFQAENTLKNKIFELVVNCKTYNFSSFDYVCKNYSEIKQEKTIDIRSIQDTTTSEKVAQWITNNLKKKFKYKIKINDAFTYELGDTVELETGIYSQQGKMIMRKAIIIGIEYEYDGALEYYLILRGE